MNYLEIHEGAVLAAKDFKRAEGKLIDNLQLVKSHQVHKKLNYSSLHVYAVEALKLSPDQAYQFTRVAEKSLEIPELKRAIHEGTLNVSAARRIVTVITPATKHEWIGKAATLTQRELEREVVKFNPKDAVRERIRPLSENLSHLQCSIPRELEDMLGRVKDLESQRMKRPADLVAALTAMCRAYLEKHDPILKAKRNLGKRPLQTKFASRQIPAQVKHGVNSRDEGRCVYVNENGERCPNRRWVEIHHKVPYAQGGRHTPENLITLCQHHHKYHHA